MLFRSYLTGCGFNEILTNSIVNSQWYNETTLSTGVKMLNNLSADLDMMRPSMLESGLQCIAFNLNRKNSTLQLFEFGKSYHINDKKEYIEADHLMIYCTGEIAKSWNHASVQLDFFYLKGICENIFAQLGIKRKPEWVTEGKSLTAQSNGKTLVQLTEVSHTSKIGRAHV